jgi:hypothetical protein
MKLLDLLLKKLEGMCVTAFSVTVLRVSGCVCLNTVNSSTGDH